MKYGLSVLIFVLSFHTFSTKEAFSYSKKNHTLITALAVEAYNRCGEKMNPRPGWFKTIDPLQKKRLLFGSIADDEDLSGKLKRWHFYDREGTLGRHSSIGFPGLNLLIKETSLHARFDQLEITADKQTDFVGAKRAWRIFDTLGKIVHYIQDVTVPAHVIPIFHPGKTLPLADQFDNYPFQITFYSVQEGSPPKATDDFFKDFEDRVGCSVLLKSSDHSFNAILDDAAGRTYRMLDHKIQGTERTWAGTFWETTVNERGFGNYGLAGNHFGKKKNCLKWEHHEKGDGGFGSARCDDWLILDQSVYDQFSSRQHMSAIEGTMRALRLLQQKMSHKPLQ